MQPRRPPASSAPKPDFDVANLDVALLEVDVRAMASQREYPSELSHTSVRACRRFGLELHIRTCGQREAELIIGLASSSFDALCCPGANFGLNSAEHKRVFKYHIEIPPACATH